VASPRSAQTRKARTDEKVFRATIDLLRTGGAGAVTVEAVATASGVAKTTIYRRHTDRIAMLRAALDHYMPRLDDIADADPRRGLVTLVRAVSTVIERYIGTSVAVLLAAADDPAARVVLDAVVQPRIHQITALIDGWRTAGLLRSDLDVDLTVSTVMGTVGVTYARHGTFPPDWPERLVAHLWPLLRPPGEPAAGSPEHPN
jgi:AcrR family transcriptional regulator